jgi:hypothetical protein
MNELLTKLSSYNIFNYLVPGSLFSIAAKRLGIVDLTDQDLATNLLTFYILGMIVSRIGSLFIEPLMKKMKFVDYAPYGDFVRASQKDLKIEVLVEVSNTYRTLASAFICLIGGFALRCASGVEALASAWMIAITLLALALVFLGSYCKQSSYVKKRVRAIQGEL